PGAEWETGRPDNRVEQGRFRWRQGRELDAPLLRPALSPDLLIELDAVAPFGGVPALLPADSADPAEEFVAVAPLRGQAALSACFSPGHLRFLGHLDLLLRRPSFGWGYPARLEANDSWRIRPLGRRYPHGIMDPREDGAPGP